MLLLQTHTFRARQQSLGGHGQRESLACWPCPHSGRLRYPLLIWMLGVSGSCVLTKQHHVFDVVAGRLVGWTSFGLAPEFALAPSATEVVTNPAATS